MKTYRKQTLIDIVICGINQIYYATVEPVILKLKRRKFEYLFRSINDDPLVSVYIPTYNRAEILCARAIPSVLSQTYKNFELIIVGDHCTDGTLKRVSRFKDARIKFFNIAKRKYRYPPTAENHWLAGPVTAANVALNHVRGKWVARIDDDDTWTKDHLKKLLDFAIDGNYEFVSAAYVTQRFGKKIINNAKNDRPRIGGTQTWLYRSYLKFFKYNINCWRKSYNRVNDLDLQDRMYCAGVRMGFLDKVVAHVMPRPGEKTVGLDAYKLTAEEKMKHFKFE